MNNLSRFIASFTLVTFLTAQPTWAGPTLVAEGGSAPATWQYPIADALGSTTELVNAKGELASVLHYDPWGKVTDTLDPSLLSGFPVPTAPVPPTLTHRFTGEPQLSGLDLVYLRARWYDPTTGRFLTRDPLGDEDPPATLPRQIGLQGIEPQLFHRDDRNPQSLHPYVYVQNNPLNLIDPTGEVAWGVAARMAVQAVRVGAVAAANWVRRNVRYEGPKPIGPGQKRVQIFEVTVKNKPVLTWEGPHESGRSLWQVRLFDRVAIVRKDVHPTPHYNVEIFGKNIHIRCD